MQPNTTRSLSGTDPNNGQSGIDINSLEDQLLSHSPDEVLSSMQQASLTQGIALAAILTVVVMTVLTVVPFFMGSGPVKKTEKPTAAAAAPAKEEVATAAPAEAAAEDSANASKNPEGKPKVSDKTMKKLGVNDVKQSDPKKNPLEESVEDLLKDL